jgi:hypothetical protein
MPTVINVYAVKPVMGFGIRWENKTQHLSVLSDDGRLAHTLLLRVLCLPQNPKIHAYFAFISAA